MFWAGFEIVNVINSDTIHIQIIYYKQSDAIERYQRTIAHLSQPPTKRNEKRMLP